MYVSRLVLTLAGLKRALEFTFLKLFSGRISRFKLSKIDFIMYPVSPLGSLFVFTSLFSQVYSWGCKCVR